MKVFASHTDETYGRIPMGELLEGKPHEQFLRGGTGNGPNLAPRQSFTRQYPRFYFLDLLALSGEFLVITRGGRLSKGPNWQKFFEAPAEGRPFYLFCTFRAQFNVEAWFLRGGGFGERLEKKWGDIWSRLAEWQDGQPIDWEAWASKIIDEYGLYWEAPDQTFAKKNMIWGLKYCLIEPMNYFGILELEYRQGKYSQELKSVRLNPAGIDYFKRLDFGSKVLRSVSSWFSAN